MKKPALYLHKSMQQARSINSSKQKLPSLKTYLESEDQQSKEAVRKFKEATSTPQMTNLERNKQQLEKLR